MQQQAADMRQHESDEEMLDADEASPGDLEMAPASQAGDDEARGSTVPVDPQLARVAEVPPFYCIPLLSPPSCVWPTVYEQDEARNSSRRLSYLGRTVPIMRRHTNMTSRLSRW